MRPSVSDRFAYMSIPSRTGPKSSTVSQIVFGLRCSGASGSGLAAPGGEGSKMCCVRGGTALRVPPMPSATFINSSTRRPGAPSRGVTTLTNPRKMVVSVS